MFTKTLSNIAQYISEAVMRIFTPNDDSYPNSGVQPFTGEIHKSKKTDN